MAGLRMVALSFKQKMPDFEIRSLDKREWPAGISEPKLSSYDFLPKRLARQRRGWDGVISSSGVE